MARDPDRPVDLRPATAGDLELLLAWRSNPEVYRHFEAQDGPLEWDAHVEWFRSRPPGRVDLIIHYGGVRVGSVYVTPDDEAGIYVGMSGLHGRGIAASALSAALNGVGRESYTARVGADNEASQRLFESVGFECVGRDGEWVRYRYESE